MTNKERLEKLGLALPNTPTAAANYHPFVQHRDLVFVSGQLAFNRGRVLYSGTVPTEVSIEEATAAARQCALNLLAVVVNACDGDLNRVRRCIRLDGFVRSANDFYDQARVMDGATDLLVAILGEGGRPARTSLGVNVLPLKASVEATTRSSRSTFGSAATQIRMVSDRLDGANAVGAQATATESTKAPREA